MDGGYPWAHLCERLWKRFVCYIEITPGPLPTPCHIWKGAKSRGQGNTAWYTTFRVGKWSVRAHIFVAVKEGRMVPGHHVDHLCKNTLCVNGEHLEVVTPQVNQDRRWEGRRKAA